MNVANEKKILILPATPELRRKAYWSLLVVGVIALYSGYLSFTEQIVPPLILASCLVCVQIGLSFRMMKDGYIAVSKERLVVSLPPFVNSMNTGEIGSIQFVPGSGKGWLRNPDRYVVRHNRYERQVDIPVRSATHRALIEPFLREHFPQHFG